jgi:hypothetical protein
MSKCVYLEYDPQTGEHWCLKTKCTICAIEIYCKSCEHRKVPRHAKSEK